MEMSSMPHPHKRSLLGGMGVRRIFRVAIIVLISINTIVLIWAVAMSSKPYVYVNLDTPSMQILTRGSTEGTPTEAYIYDYKTDQKFSFLKYAHINGIEDPISLSYHFDGITYKFGLNDKKPLVSFELDKIEYNLIDDGKNIILKHPYKVWPFAKKTVVCALPDGECFYNPISIAGLDGYAIFISTPGLDGVVENNVTVYVQAENGWIQSQFLLPSGDSADVFTGHIRRHFDAEHPELPTKDKAVGNLEFCKENEDGTAALYSVTYTDGKLVLDAVKTYAGGLPSDWKF